MYCVSMTFPADWKLEEVWGGEDMPIKLEFTNDTVRYGSRRVFVKSAEFFALAVYPPDGDYMRDGITVYANKS